MEQTIIGLQIQLMREYYKYFSKYSRGKKPNKKVAWVTSFAPVEILDALDILYYFPESYAAVIASSNMEQQYINTAEKIGLTSDCCSYSCCFEGCIEEEGGPRGIPPFPDILIATNNQCNTLPGWWNILSERFGVPLVVLDYPGEISDEDMAYEYVKMQHEALIKKLEELSGNVMNNDLLKDIIERSAKSIKEWNRLVDGMCTKDISVTNMFDDLFFLISMRDREETAVLYRMMADEVDSCEVLNDIRPPIFLVGYPLWYSPDRYFKDLLDEFRVVGSNYVTWWSLDYSGNDVYDCLFNAYNFTFLNLKQETRNRRLSNLIEKSGAIGVVTLRNKSCKCDFVSSKDITKPQAEIDIDMIDREFMDIGAAKRSIEILKSML